MSATDKATQTQLANIATRTGKTQTQLFAALKKSGLTKHGEMLKLLKTEFGMGHGDANLISHLFRKEKEPASSPDADPLDAIYSGKKEPLRVLHEAVMKKLTKLGAFEIAAKKANISLRRKKQFALIGPGTRQRLEIGINLKGIEGTERLVAQKPGGMCQFKVWLTDKREVDKQLIDWIKLAFDAAE